MSIEYTNYFDNNEVDHIETVEETIVEDQPTMMGVIYNAQKVYMRKSPDKESPHVDILENGEEVMIDGTAEDVLGNGWYHLVTASGNEGYTMSDFVRITE